jgi:hypothetical protein
MNGHRLRIEAALTLCLAACGGGSGGRDASGGALGHDLGAAGGGGLDGAAGGSDGGPTDGGMGGGGPDAFFCPHRDALPCPAPCEGRDPGQPCAPEGQVCGDAFGAGCACDGGRWACGTTPSTDPECALVCDPEDPCAGVDLPPCPPPCTGVNPGDACAPEGARCGNAIGDACTCAQSRWQCEVHPPLEPGCNLVCRPPGR